METGLSLALNKQIPRAENKTANTLVRKVQNAIDQLPSLPEKVKLPEWADASKVITIEKIPDIVTLKPEQSITSAMVAGALNWFCPNYSAVRAYMEKSGNILPPSYTFSALAADLWDGLLQPVLTPVADPAYLRDVGTNLKMAATPPPV